MHFIVQIKSYMLSRNREYYRTYMQTQKKKQLDSYLFMLPLKTSQFRFLNKHNHAQTLVCHEIFEFAAITAILI